VGAPFSKRVGEKTGYVRPDIALQAGVGLGGEVKETMFTLGGGEKRKSGQSKCR